jgi:hypothetical protein
MHDTCRCGINYPLTKRSEQSSFSFLPLYNIGGSIHERTSTGCMATTYSSHTRDTNVLLNHPLSTSCVEQQQKAIFGKSDSGIAIFRGSISSCYDSSRTSCQDAINWLLVRNKIFQSHVSIWRWDLSPTHIRIEGGDIFIFVLHNLHVYSRQPNFLPPTTLTSINICMSMLPMYVHSSYICPIPCDSLVHNYLYVHVCSKCVLKTRQRLPPPWKWLLLMTNWTS